MGAEQRNAEGDFRETRGSSRPPCEGPFYWLKLEVKMTLKAMPSAVGSGDWMGHPKFWESIVDSDIAPFFGLTDPRTIRELKNVPYSMPRGRVTAIAGRLGVPKTFVVYAGEKMTEAQKRQVINAFSLGDKSKGGLVQFRYDEHESTLAADTARYLSLLPAKTKRR
jgi:hypothetical protein